MSLPNCAVLGRLEEVNCDGVPLGYRGSGGNLDERRLKVFFQESVLLQDALKGY